MDDYGNVENKLEGRSIMSIWKSIKIFSQLSGCLQIRWRRQLNRTLLLSYAICKYTFHLTRQYSRQSLDNPWLCDERFAHSFYTCVKYLARKLCNS